MLGIPVSQFVVEATDAAARQVLSEHRTLRIPQECAAEFFAWLDEPARVIPEMQRLVAAEPFEQA